MTIDHLTIPIRDYARSKRFYERALEPLGLVVLLDWPDRRRAYFGVPGAPSTLWLVESFPAGRLDISLLASDAEAVDAFYAAARAAGAERADAPGIRDDYSRDYYAARVLDPDGNSIEAVARTAAAAAA